MFKKTTSSVLIISMCWLSITGCEGNNIGGNGKNVSAMSKSIKQSSAEPEQSKIYSDSKKGVYALSYFSGAGHVLNSLENKGEYFFTPNTILWLDENRKMWLLSLKSGLTDEQLSKYSEFMAVVKQNLSGFTAINQSEFSTKVIASNDNQYDILLLTSSQKLVKVNLTSSGVNEIATNVSDFVYDSFENVVSLIQIDGKEVKLNRLNLSNLPSLRLLTGNTSDKPIVVDTLNNVNRPVASLVSYSGVSAVSINDEVSYVDPDGQPQTAEVNAFYTCSEQRGSCDFNSQNIVVASSMLVNNAIPSSISNIINKYVQDRKLTIQSTDFKLLPSNVGNSYHWLEIVGLITVPLILGTIFGCLFKTRTSKSAAKRISDSGISNNLSDTTRFATIDSMMDKTLYENVNNETNFKFTEEEFKTEVSLLYEEKIAKEKLNSYASNEGKDYYVALENTKKLAKEEGVEYLQSLNLVEAYNSMKNSFDTNVEIPAETINKFRSSKLFEADVMLTSRNSKNISLNKEEYNDFVNRLEEYNRNIKSGALKSALDLKNLIFAGNLLKDGSFEKFLREHFHIDARNYQLKQIIEENMKSSLSTNEMNISIVSEGGQANQKTEFSIPDRTILSVGTGVGTGLIVDGLYAGLYKNAEKVTIISDPACVKSENCSIGTLVDKDAKTLLNKESEPISVNFGSVKDSYFTTNDGSQFDIKYYHISSDGVSCARFNENVAKVSASSTKFTHIKLLGDDQPIPIVDYNGNVCNLTEKEVFDRITKIK